MATRDQSKPAVRGLDKRHAEQAHHPAGARPVSPAHYRKSSDSNRKHYGAGSIINRGK